MESPRGGALTCGGWTSGGCPWNSPVSTRPSLLLLWPHIKHRAHPSNWFNRHRVVSGERSKAQVPGAAPQLSPQDILYIEKIIGMGINYVSLSSKWPAPVCKTPSVCVELYLGFPPCTFSALPWTLRLTEAIGHMRQLGSEEVPRPGSQPSPPQANAASSLCIFCHLTASAFKTFRRNLPPRFSIPVSFGPLLVLPSPGFQGHHSQRTAAH